MLAPSPKITSGSKEYFKSLADHCAQYKGADTRRSILQAVITMTLFFASVSAMYGAVVTGAWWLYALLMVPTAGLLVRVFIIQHDCGHGSYFNNRKANDWVGRTLSLFTVTPYSFWRRTHNMHHASSGNLDKRGYGGIETITVAEYQSMSLARQKMYRFYRNVYALLGFGTPFFTLVIQRFVVTEPFLPEFSVKGSLKNSWKSIYSLNVALLLFYGTLGYFIGYATLAIVYLPVVIMTAWMGGWLFYIQHQFEDTYWDRQKEWNYNEAAIMSSSYYDLPKIVQWFSGNIGLHHIHHLNATIPNYKLQECLDAHPDLPRINHLTFKESLQTVKLALWDEAQRKLITFKEFDRVHAIPAA